MVLGLLNFIIACKSPCQGNGCSDATTSSILTFLQLDSVIPERDIEDAALIFNGSLDQGVLFSVQIDQNHQYWIGNGATQTLYLESFQIGKRDIQSSELTSDIPSFGHEILLLEDSIQPYFVITAPQSDLTTDILDSGSLWIYDATTLTQFSSIESSQLWMNFPDKIWPCGDLDQDGLLDFAVSLRHSGGDLYRGEVLLGLSSIWNQQSSHNLDDFPRLQGNAVGEGFGHSVLCDTDINQDGSIDLLISSPFADVINPIDASLIDGAGRIAFYSYHWEHFSAQLPDAIFDTQIFDTQIFATQIFEGRNLQQWLGYRMTLGDLNQDGIWELLHTNFASDNTYVNIHSLRDIDNQDWTEIGRIEAPEKDSFFGYQVKIGHLNEDNFADIIVTAPFASNDSLNEMGMIYLYPGDGETFEFTNPSSLIQGSKSDSRLGQQLWLKDVNDDGLDDIISTIQHPL